MIAYDLRCSRGHVFESWFPDSFAFDEQSRGHLLECPLCGDDEIERAPMAPNVSTSRARKKSEKEYTRRAMTALTNAQALVQANCEDVGDRFADEARKIHHGETEKRNIWGSASPEDVSALQDEGIEFSEIPFQMPRKDA
ncbi:MAG: DUF1178 family protein [Proteobacteria bacterium]|nr:DUF1178 family protein [Pseudomonadota bacterium]MDA1132815.1 DUF1178 family protein [Pseudomonadota bacterium]